MTKKTVAMSVSTMFCVLMVVSVGHAFVPADVDQLIQTGLCSRCDLSGANLSGISGVSDLTEANLSGANLYTADLSGVDLCGANLTGANLKEASLKGTDLSGTDLSGADLTGADLTGTTFGGAKLDNTTWTDGSTCKAGSVEKCEHDEHDQ
ncbi:MAG: pentapeptide repeat-containing protein [Candidatus Korobacteraceae bacterium]|jgi:uncharacterized protein YjbI with pentapeptide repeats